VTNTFDDDAGRGSARPPISKTLRFEVFKRDSFTCQYCGERAPDVILHCDHVKPVAEGGTTDILNLVTACVDCNLGKGARKLSENAALLKQLKQLDALQERREKMEMMLAWRDELDQLDEIPPLELEKRWDQLTGYTFTETGKKKIKKLINRFGLDEVSAAMKVAVDQYVEKDDDGAVTRESVEIAFDYIGGIANVRRAEQREPGTKQMFYIRGILRKRLNYCPEWKALALIKDAARSGVSLDLLGQIAREATSWTNFCEMVVDAANEVTEHNRANEQQRARMLGELEAAFGPAHAPEALDLVLRALAVGMSEDYLLTMTQCSDWKRYSAWLQWATDWWSRFVRPIQDVLGEAVPTDQGLGLILSIMLDLHMPHGRILAAAGRLRSWSRLEAWLEDAYDKLWEEQQRERDAEVLSDASLGSAGFRDLGASVP